MEIIEIDQTRLAHLFWLIWLKAYLSFCQLEHDSYSTH